ncbi:MAG TPA: DUF4349 domain-containing protein [Gemmatimonadaceae bacterium]|nr:DUF4349 domain-containing protein [Gemmatimonadaceae bacterium]
MKSMAVVAAAFVLLACNGGKERNESAPGLTGSADRGMPTLASDEAPKIMAAQRAPFAPPSSQSDQATTAQPAADVAPSMLIRTGSASIEVDKLDPAILKVRQIASQLGGYIANSSIVGGRDQVRSATLEVKIPAARYDQAVGALGGIGKVESVNTSVEDVGEEFVDINARVANAKRLEERLVNLLATRTGKLEDVLAVERELARVREEIERSEGRIRYLKTRAAISTLSVTVHEPMPILGQNPGDNPIVGAFKQAWRNFVGFVAWLIASLGVLIPLGVVLGGGWYVYRRIRRSKA